MPDTGRRVIRQWRKMLVRGLITPSEHMLFRRIAELELDNARLKKNTPADGGMNEMNDDKRIGYINVYTNGRTSKLCASRKAADHTATQVELDRVCVWRVAYDADGANPTIAVERIEPQ